MIKELLMLTVLKNLLSRGIYLIMKRVLKLVLLILVKCSNDWLEMLYKRILVWIFKVGGNFDF